MHVSVNLLRFFFIILSFAHFTIYRNHLMVIHRQQIISDNMRKREIERICPLIDCVYLLMCCCFWLFVRHTHTGSLIFKINSQQSEINWTKQDKINWISVYKYSMEKLIQSIYNLGCSYCIFYVRKVIGFKLEFGCIIFVWLYCRYWFWCWWWCCRLCKWLWNPFVSSSCCRIFFCCEIAAWRRP